KRLPLRLTVGFDAPLEALAGEVDAFHADVLERPGEPRGLELAQQAVNVGQVAADVDVEHGSPAPVRVAGDERARWHSVLACVVLDDGRDGAGGDAAEPVQGVLVGEVEAALRGRF